MNIRNDFPILFRPKISVNDISFVTDRDKIDISDAPWCMSWLTNGAHAEQALREIVGIAFDGVFVQFIERFLQEYCYFGVLYLLPDARSSYPENSWVVFKKRADQSDNPTIVDLIDAKPGTFVYLSERNLETCANSAVSDVVSAFFAMFGGLRDTIPFWGGDYFPKVTRPLFGGHGEDEERLKARDAYEPRWLGSHVVCVRGNCDYFVVGKDGAVGYIPVEGNRRIEVVASSFLEYLLYWISEDRGRYYGSEPNGEICNLRGIGAAKFQNHVISVIAADLYSKMALGRSRATFLKELASHAELIPPLLSEIRACLAAEPIPRNQIDPSDITHVDAAAQWLVGAASIAVVSGDQNLAADCVQLRHQLLEGVRPAWSASHIPPDSTSR